MPTGRTSVARKDKNKYRICKENTHATFDDQPCSNKWAGKRRNYGQTIGQKKEDRHREIRENRNKEMKGKLERKAEEGKERKWKSVEKH